MPLDPRVERLREDVMLFNRRFRSKRSNHLLTATQLAALAHLDQVGPMNARALADLEQVAPQSIARTVTLLLEGGMISRTADPADARACVLSLTDVGLRTLTEDRAQRSQWLSIVMKQRCSEAEREMLFIAGHLLRRLADSPDPAADNDQ